MRSKLFVVASFMGAFAVILGALAAHALKEKLSPVSLESFNTGARYQMYHAIVLLIISVLMNSQNVHKLKWVALLMLYGSLLFSISIYLLSTRAITGMHLTWLGPITPLGGLLMICGWLLLAFNVKFVFTNNS